MVTMIAVSVLLIAPVVQRYASRWGLVSTFGLVKPLS